jgi:hypothetical protein
MYTVSPGSSLEFAFVIVQKGFVKFPELESEHVPPREFLST